MGLDRATASPRFGLGYSGADDCGAGTGEGIKRHIQLPAGSGDATQRAAMDVIVEALSGI